MDDQPRPVNRLTVVETVYHQKPGDGLSAVESRFTRTLKTDDHPYFRSVRLSSRWVLLDTGWIAVPGMVVVKNDSPPEHTDWIVELTFADPTRPDVLIPPGESCRFTPYPGRSVFVRSVEGNPTVSVSAFPG